MFFKAIVIGYTLGSLILDANILMHKRKIRKLDKEIDEIKEEVKCFARAHGVELTDEAFYRLIDTYNK